jgi:hypothetical protein
MADDVIFTPWTMDDILSFSCTTVFEVNLLRFLNDTKKLHRHEILSHKSSVHSIFEYEGSGWSGWNFPFPNKRNFTILPLILWHLPVITDVFFPS